MSIPSSNSEKCARREFQDEEEAGKTPQQTSSSVHFCRCRGVAILVILYLGSISFEDGDDCAKLSEKETSAKTV